MKITTKLIIVSVLLLSVTILAQTDIPYLTGRVTDNAQILSPETKQSLSESLRDHENRTGNQIAVLTVPTIYEESIEENEIEHQGRRKNIQVLLAAQTMVDDPLRCRAAVLRYNYRVCPDNGARPVHIYVILVIS